MLESTEIICPYCGERIVLEVDCSAGDQRYIEDCQVCCAPIEVSVRLAPDGSFSDVIARRDDE